MLRKSISRAVNGDQFRLMGIPNGYPWQVTVLRFSKTDIVILHNGDRITGEFVQLEAGYLTFATGYADSIKVQADQVVSMKTDAPVFVYFSGGTMEEGMAFFHGSNALEGMEQAGIDVADAVSIYTSLKPPVRYTVRANVGITNQNGNTDSC